ncbi:MAG: AprI/Inh family metalloprotease inhibitor [Methylocella sp.]
MRAAAPLPRVQVLAGLCELSVDGTNTKCRILPRPAYSAAAYRRTTIPRVWFSAFPVLAYVDTRSLTGNDRLQCSGRTGRTRLDIAPTVGASFVACGPQGQTFRLAEIDDAAQENKPAGNQGGNTAPPYLATTQASPAAAPADAAGRYAILRDGGKDSGCMLTLDNQGKAPGRKKASLAPGCRDQGIVIFDPAGWQIVNGRLVLTARKGHKTYLDAQPDGTWKKDPKEGKSLTLKKL